MKYLLIILTFLFNLGCESLPVEQEEYKETKQEKVKLEIYGTILKEVNGNIILHEDIFSVTLVSYEKNTGKKKIGIVMPAEGHKYEVIFDKIEKGDYVYKLIFTMDSPFKQEITEDFEINCNMRIQMNPIMK